MTTQLKETTRNEYRKQKDDAPKIKEYLKQIRLIEKPSVDSNVMKRKLNLFAKSIDNMTDKMLNDLD